MPSILDSRAELKRKIHRVLAMPEMFVPRAIPPEICFIATYLDGVLFSLGMSIDTYSARLTSPLAQKSGLGRDVHWMRHLDEIRNVFGEQVFLECVDMLIDDLMNHVKLDET
jgi:hypothetical protein